MIRLREFNMAELEYFIDPEMPINHDFSKWTDTLIAMIPDESKEIKITLSQAVESSIIRHPTVGFFMGMTYDFMRKVGIDLDRVRFRQHESNEMAHYATDCWDLEILGSYGWVECVGIAHRGCYDLQAHEEATNKSLRARREFHQPKEVIIDGWTIDGAKAGPAFRSLAGQVKSKVEELPKDAEFPISLKLNDGEEVTVEQEHVKRVQKSETLTGEWFVPHVVEPAFGIDRIIWHVLDHAYNETQKESETYTIMKLEPSVTPVDFCVFQLFEKDGMQDIATEITNSLNSRVGIVANYDASGSIGRRYARADEAGVPVCITVDHQSVEDRTVTVRDRDTGEQSRVTIDNL